MQPEEPVNGDEICSIFTLGKAMTEALGLQGRRVTRIQLDMQAGQTPKVLVTELMTQSQGLAAAALLRTHWVLKPAGEPAQLDTVKLDGSEPSRP